MARRLRAALTRPAIGAWIRFSEDSWRDFPRPQDEPRVYTPGLDPVHILVLGGGANMGYGVSTHQLSFGGQLSRQLSRRMSRGVDVDIAAISELLLRRAGDHLPAGNQRVDALVTTFGSVEAYHLRSTSAWRRDVEQFLAQVHTRDPGTHTFFGGIVPPGSLVAAPTFARQLIAERVEMLNGISRTACRSAAQVTFVPFPRNIATRNPDRPTEQYRAGATAFVDAIAAWLSSPSS